ncbi:unnamed protein product [Dimorphilus gyrociliatus]|uniref:Uncharacterized protein n=1 Tax=Dimorphilus gyrociliatus TaxID=2664684 RepID=A0A7I8VAF3_9ANNE|nr:unnamed protein product [Dimorphilus gyrociliatus]
MALLGVQLIASIVMASILSKISTRFSFCRLLFGNRLITYLPPTMDELKSAANIRREPKPKGHRKNHQKDENEDFNIPRNVNISLDSAPVRNESIMSLKFSSDLQWILDYCVCSIVIYFLIEVYYKLLGNRVASEFNLSLVWIGLGVAFSYKVLFSLTAIYFKVHDGGERITCVMNAFFSLVISMAVLLGDGKVLEFGLQKAYANFSGEVAEFLKTKGLDSSPPRSYLTLQIFLTIFSALIGGALTFPGLRLARMYKSALKYSSSSVIISLGLHLNMIIPGIGLLAWARPITSGQLNLCEEHRELIKAYTVIASCVFRFLLALPMFQAYLNLPVEHVDSLRKQSGKISATEYRGVVSRVFSYFAIVALQYFAPLLLLLHSGIGLRSLTALPSPQLMGELSKAILSYLTWWTMGSWFLTSAIGTLYLSYFSDY